MEKMDLRGGFFIFFLLRDGVATLNYGATETILKRIDDAVEILLFGRIIKNAVLYGLVGYIELDTD
jgi:hypothetical protein